jgi:hypothetical protein
MLLRLALCALKTRSAEAEFRQFRSLSFAMPRIITNSLQCRLREPTQCIVLFNSLGKIAVGGLQNSYPKPLLNTFKERLMSSNTQLHLFGSLKKTIEDQYDIPILFGLDVPTPLIDVLARFNIPLEMVQLAMVNHRAVPKASVIHPGDRISLFPREYIVFTDWKDFRF